MGYLLIRGDARRIPLADNTVTCCITIPPYWGLREYSGVEPSVWDGDPLCQHAFGDAGRKGGGAGAQGATSQRQGRSNVEEQAMADASTGQFCSLCSAWKGCLGLEPTIGLFVSHLVEIFREVRRVLHPQGCAWVNLGDSYATGSNGRSAAATKVAGNDDRTHRDKPFSTVGELPAKNLCGIPWRVALALQADGWFLRSDVIISKANPLPSSVQDRPAVAHEYLFLFSNQANYYYDSVAVREPASGTAHSRGNGVHPKSAAPGSGVRANESFESAVRHIIPERNLRTVWTDDTPNVRLREGVTDEERAHVAQVLLTHPELRDYFESVRTSDWSTVHRISTEPLSGAAYGVDVEHYASFPAKMIEPCVKASAGDCCDRCKQPWERLTEKGSLHADAPGYRPRGRPAPDGFVARGMTLRGSTQPAPNHHYETRSLGFRPTCACYDAHYRADFPQARSARKRHQRALSGDWWRRVRAKPGRAEWPRTRGIVLDPFCGSGTTGVVALRHGRRFLGIDASAEYLNLARARLARPFHKPSRRRPAVVAGQTDLFSLIEEDDADR